MDELTRQVAQRAGILPDQAQLAVAAMLAYLTARLPSPVVGRIRDQLDAAQDASHADVDHGGSE